MSLDITLLETKPTAVYDINITHNLTAMAQQAGVYRHLWRASEIGVHKASQLILPLTKAIADMKKRPEYYKHFDAENGWGTYKDFLPWLEELLSACIEHPHADIEISA